jgi:A/G-specific adenine glycosylase
MNTQEFLTLLIEWYTSHKRDLPWRKTKNPYKIWLSEIMLQQTRVNQGLPYYLKFVRQYPTVQALALAPENEVLRLWQGLGYYSRARNLHRCSKIVLSELNGKFPASVHALKKLPGIGDYTAAAIASLAFGIPAAVVDGNVFRVLARLFEIKLDVASPAGKKYFFELANNLIPQDQPGEFNQAIMEFGAVHCVPRNPNCPECIFKKSCLAYKNGTQDLFPVKAKAKKKRIRYFNYFVIRSGAKTWMKQRTEKDIWQGLNEFYLIESSRNLSDRNAIQLFTKEIGLNSMSLINSTKIEQTLSHQKIIGKYYEVEIPMKLIPKKLKAGKFYSLKEIEGLAKPVVIVEYLSTTFS